MEHTQVVDAAREKSAWLPTAPTCMAHLCAGLAGPRCLLDAGVGDALDDLALQNQDDGEQRQEAQHR